MRPQCTTPLVVTLAIAAIGCSDAQTAHTTAVDSAGTTIVTISEASLDELPRYHLLAPDLHLGADETAEGETFHDIVGGALLANGGFVIADGGSTEVRRFDRSGVLLGRFGGVGGGPGEFVRLSSVQRTTGDTLVAFDGRLGRLTLFSGDGEVLQVRTLPETISALGGRAIRLADGATVVVPGWSLRLMQMTKPGRHRATVPLLAFSATSDTPDTLGLFPGLELLVRFLDGGGYNFRIPPLGLDLIVAASKDRLFLSSADSAVVHIFRSDGREVGTTRLHLDLRLTGVERTMDDVDPEDLPDLRPAFVDAVATEDGTWFSRGVLEEGAATWIAIGYDGTPSAMITTPASFRPLDVRDDRVLGVFTNELDVQTVQVRKLTTSGDDAVFVDLVTP